MAGSFVNFVEANDVENDALLSFSGPDLRPNSLSLPIIDLHWSSNSLTLSEREAFSLQNGVMSSRVLSHRSPSIFVQPP